MITSPSSPTQQVLPVYEQLLGAWNRRDADAFASVFSADATVVGFDGSQMTGRDQIASELRAIFANHQTAAYVARIKDIREVAPNTVLVRSAVGMVPPGQSEINPAVNAVQCLVGVVASNGITIVLLQNTPAAFHGRPQLAEALTRELSSVLRTGRIVEDGRSAE